MKKILVNHIPKTGGTHMISALANALPKGKRAYRWQIRDDVWRLANAILDPDVVLISGHYLGAQDFWTPELAANATMLTTVRDPVVACMSAWDFYRQPQRLGMDLTPHKAEGRGHGAWGPGRSHADMIRWIQNDRVHHGDYGRYLTMSSNPCSLPLFNIRKWPGIDVGRWINWTMDPEGSAKVLSEVTGLNVQVPDKRLQNRTPKGLDRDRWYAPTEKALNTIFAGPRNEVRQEESL